MTTVRVTPRARRNQAMAQPNLSSAWTPSRGSRPSSARIAQTRPNQWLRPRPISSARASSRNLCRHLASFLASQLPSSKCRKGRILTSPTAAGSARRARTTTSKAAARATAARRARMRATMMASPNTCRWRSPHQSRRAIKRPPSDKSMCRPALPASPGARILTVRC